MLAGELARHRVEVPHPLHGDEERLVRGETGRAQLGDLVAEVVLELVDVVTVDGRAFATWARHSAICVSMLSTAQVSRIAVRRATGPDVVERARDGLPLPLVIRQRRASGVGDHVVLAAAPSGGVRHSVVTYPSRPRRCSSG